MKTVVTWACCASLLLSLPGCSNEVVINSFTEIPADLGGPGCSYGSSKNEYEAGKFVFIDGEGKAMMKINGELQALEFSEYLETPRFYKDIYKNDDLEVTIARRKHQHSEQTEEIVESGDYRDEPEKASITVKHGSKTTSIKVVGLCSCC